jgi:thiol-disulfide isomerase/thioredoxin
MRPAISIVAVAFLTLSTSLQANINAGHDYAVLDVPQLQENDGKIEVVEFFSWGCPHCYEFYPKLARWLATMPKGSSFKRVPVAIGHTEWEALAKAYYALQSTGDVDRLDSQIFEDIHKNHVWLNDEPSITAWVGKHGVDVAKFTAASFLRREHFRGSGGTKGGGLSPNGCADIGDRRQVHSQWRPGENAVDVGSAHCHGAVDEQEAGEVGSPVRSTQNLVRAPLSISANPDCR